MRNRTHFLMILGALALMIPMFGQDVVVSETTQGGGPSEPEAVPAGYIVMFAPGTSAPERAAAAFAAGAAVRFIYAGVEAVAITVPNQNALAALANNPNVERIVPDFIVEGAVKGGNGKGKPGSDPPPPEPLNLDTE